MVGIEPRERVLQRLIEEEMRESFLDYSMSVIVQRALPDVRDGLKPVHRRILYAMHGLGLNPGRPYKKSAAVVGEVLGKFHPHGDAAVYDALVRMVQDFSLRYPLVDGQGNFGSIDGDNAAAYRYTEAKLAPVALSLLGDIDKDTVDFTPTFDSQREEPEILPAVLPNLLVNGSSGIAVGMSTNVPPHNLREIAAAVHLLIENPECTLDELLELVPGPDFPTGGLIVGRSGIRDAFETGRGRIVMRARVQKEARRDGKEQLVVTELPYGVSKSKVVEQIADLVRARKIDTVSDLRDESDRDGMRIVVELKRGANPKDVLRYLCRHTYLQQTFGAIMLSLDHGQPVELGLKEILGCYRDHRIEVIQRRARHELEEAKRDAHIAEGLIIALDNIDAVIGIIRESKDREDAGRALQKRFGLSDVQAAAILDMRLHRLTSLEQSELRDRLAKLKARIAELEELLASDALQRQVLLEELDAVVERFGDSRRTTIIEVGKNEYVIPDLVAQEEWVVTVSREGFVKRIPMNLYRRRVESGKPIAGMERYEDDWIERMFIADTHDTVLVFTQDGKAHSLPVMDVPETARSSRGRSLAQLLELDDVEVAALVPAPDFSPQRTAIFAMASGTVKRTELDQFASIRSGGIAAVGLKKGDRIVDVRLGSGTTELVLVSGEGRAIRFPEDEIPTMGRTAQGVKGMQLRKNDRLVGMLAPRRDALVCTVSEKGFVQRTPVADLSVQKRGGLGSVVMKVTSKTGAVVSARELLPGEDLMVVTAAGPPAIVPSASLPAAGDAAAKPMKETGGSAVLEAHATRAADRDPGEQLDLMGEGG